MLSQLSFAGQTVVVSGAASGIGRACCEVLAELGADLVLVDLDGAGAAEVAGRYAGARAYQLDVADEAAVGEFARRLAGEAACVKALLNIAGINLRGELESLSLRDWQRVLDTDLTSIFLMTRALLPLLEASPPPAAVVNVASSFALIGSPAMPAYCAAKGGVVSLTRQIALDYGRRGIRANAVCPGPTLSPLIEGYIHEGSVTQEKLAANLVLGRLASPREIANVIVFLASDAASFVQGAAVVVDGGQTIHTGPLG